MPFINEDFLLHTDKARRLYHDYAAKQPILDYHSHLSAAEIACDRRFQNLFEIWLEGDHYKWRAMRANGVPERYCTGNATPYEKYMAWAQTVPFALRNPLYHWTHLELKRYFGIDDLLQESTSQSIWNRANSLLAGPHLSARGILRKFDVRLLCTSDDPCDDLRPHSAINNSEPVLRVYPTFRPDNALQISNPAIFNSWVTRLEESSNMEVASLRRFQDALRRRHDYFHVQGARLSDHGLQRCCATPCSEKQATAIFDNVRAGRAASDEEQEQFSSYMMLFFGRLDAEKGWIKQLHLGALRAVNTRRTQELGADSGFDSMGDWPQAMALCAYLDCLDREGALPKIIVYNLNPADNYVFATAIGSFQDESIPGKIQMGAAWWFLDHKDGIRRHLDALSRTGLLSRFIGMVTDSRSFMSFPRHEYFRRVLCDILGREMENGELPDDEELIGGMVQNICFENARQYLGVALGSLGETRDQGITVR